MFSWRLSFNGRSRGCSCQKFAIAGKTVESQSREEICHDPYHAKFVAITVGHKFPSTHCPLTVLLYQILRVLNRLFLYSCSKPEHPPVGDHSCITGNRSRLRIMRHCDVEGFTVRDSDTSPLRL